MGGQFAPRAVGGGFAGLGVTNARQEAYQGRVQAMHTGPDVSGYFYFRFHVHGLGHILKVPLACGGYGYH